MNSASGGLLLSLLLIGTVSAQPDPAAVSNAADSASEMTLREMPTREEIDEIRRAVRGERSVLLANAMRLTPAEEKPFWSLYRAYRAEIEPINDRLIQLFLEFSDIHQTLDEARARAMLTDYQKLENRRRDVQALYWRKFDRALGAIKTLRLVQLETRFDLVLRLQWSGALPLAPIRQQPD